MSTYKRSQVEDTLWSLARLGAAPARTPAAFRTRVNKLLNLDRIEQPDLAGLPLAFNDELPEGQGQDVPFTSFNALVMGLGLELWNAGMKQSDVIFFLRHSRAAIEKQQTLILTAAHESENVIVPGKPTRMISGAKFRDKRVYMLVAMKNFSAATGKARPADGGPVRAMMFLPHFVEGSDALKPFFDEVPPALRTWLTVEIGEFATEIDSRLKTTPPRRRGRPS